MAHICPIDNNKLNEPTVRVVATFMGILAVLALVFKLPFLFGIMVADFLIRGFFDRKYSLFRWLATKVVDALDMEPKIIPAAPKTFSAKIGFLFSAILLIASLANSWIVVYPVASILLVCIFLEAVFAYCVGCVMYSTLVKVKLIKAQ